MRGIPAYGNGLTIIASTEPLQPHQRELFMQRYDEGRALLGTIGIKDGLAGFERLVAMGDEDAEGAVLASARVPQQRRHALAGVPPAAGTARPLLLEQLT